MGQRPKEEKEKAKEPAVTLTREQQQQGRWRCLWCRSWFDRFVGLRSHLVGCLKRAAASTKGDELAVGKISWKRSVPTTSVRLPCGVPFSLFPRVCRTTGAAPNAWWKEVKVVREVVPNVWTPTAKGGVRWRHSRSPSRMKRQNSRRYACLCCVSVAHTCFCGDSAVAH